MTKRIVKKRGRLTKKERAELVKMLRSLPRKLVARMRTVSLELLTLIEKVLGEK